VFGGQRKHRDPLRKNPIWHRNMVEARGHWAFCGQVVQFARTVPPGCDRNVPAGQAMAA
jgi:hypothetical protein